MGIPPYMFQGVAVEIGNISEGIVKVNFGRTTGATELLNIIAAAHAQDIMEDVGEFEGEVGGVISAQAAAGRGDPDIGAVTIIADRRHKIMYHEILIGVVADGAPMGIYSGVQPRLVIQPL